MKRLGRPIARVLAPARYLAPVMAIAVMTVGTARAGDPSISACALGSDVPGLTGYYAPALAQAADHYVTGLSGADAATQSKARSAFTAAAAAYVYGFPQVVERETVKHFPRNQIVSVAALANPSVTTVVAPNVDTAYTVAWIDLTSGPEVINVPDTGGRFYTFQFLDAFTNAFAYVGTGSTGTHAGAYALIPPGWSGAIPAGVTAIHTPSNTVWLLGRTLVENSADLPAVKRLQQQYELTPLAAWEAGTRQPPVVLDSYPPTIPKSVPAGVSFISELNRDMEIDPPPSADTCALQAMAPAGVAVPHPGPGQSLLESISDEAPPAPAVAGDPVASAAINAGTAAAAQITATGDADLNAASRAAENGWEVLGNWVGAYGTRYLGRTIVATDLLAANTPQQTIYPIADTDIRGRVLSGAYRYTIHFPRGQLPPTHAFWSLTMYDSSYYLYANAISRYAIGDRTTGLVRGHDGSVTIYVQHAAPASADARANWLPAPAGQFHLILRLYQPAAAAIDGTWKPAPVLRSDELLAARASITGLRVTPRAFRPAHRGALTARRGPARVSFRASEATVTRFTLLRLIPRAGCRPRPGRSCLRARVLARFDRRARAGANHFYLTGRLRGKRLRAGRYRLRAQPAATAAGLPPGRAVSAGFRVR